MCYLTTSVDSGRLVVVEQSRDQARVRRVLAGDVQRQRSVRRFSEQTLLKIGGQNSEDVLGTLGGHGRDVDGQEPFGVGHVAAVHLVAVAKFQGKKSFHGGTNAVALSGHQVKLNKMKYLIVLGTFTR